MVEVEYETLMGPSSGVTLNNGLIRLLIDVQSCLPPNGTMLAMMMMMIVVIMMMMVMMTANGLCLCIELHNVPLCCVKLRYVANLL